MAMQFKTLTPFKQGVMGQIYDYFNGYALGQGASAGEAREFAYLGMGVASGEGMSKPDRELWKPNPDEGVTSVGPFQLNINTGIGRELNGNFSPQNQLYVAARNMWGEPGTDGYYNTQPWNAVGDTTGPGRGRGNDTVIGQDAAISIGQRYDARYGFSGGSSAPPDIAPAGATPTPAGASGPIPYSETVKAVESYKANPDGETFITAEGREVKDGEVFKGEDGTLWQNRNGNPVVVGDSISTPTTPQIAIDASGNIDTIPQPTTPNVRVDANGNIDTVPEGGTTPAIGTPMPRLGNTDAAAGETFKQAEHIKGDSSVGGSATVPQALDNMTKGLGKDTTALAKAATSSAKGVATALNSSTKQIVSAANSINSKIDAAEKNIFTRGSFILLGLVFVVGGVTLFSRQSALQLSPIHAFKKVAHA